MKKSFDLLICVLCAFSIAFLLSLMFIVDDIHQKKIEYKIINSKSSTNILMCFVNLFVNFFNEFITLIFF